ncbi:hypothetical protein D3C74_399580 [compost metagenome]
MEDFNFDSLQRPFVVSQYKRFNGRRAFRKNNPDIEQFTPVQMHMGTQETVNLDHVVIFIKYDNAMSDRIHHILVGYGR